MFPSLRHNGTKEEKKVANVVVGKTGQRGTYPSREPSLGILFFRYYLTHLGRDLEILVIHSIHCTQMVKLRLMGVKGLPKATASRSWVRTGVWPVWVPAMNQI